MNMPSTTKNAIRRQVDIELNLLARTRKPKVIRKASQEVKGKEPTIRLGTNQVTGKSIEATLDTLLTNNLHLVGASRTGKTKLILKILTQLLQQPNTSIVVPVAKGSLGRELRDMVLKMGLGHRLIWIDPSDYSKGISIALDFLMPNSREISTHVGTVREALVYGHGQAEGMDQTRQMARILYTVLYAARSANLTIVEALRILRDKEFRLEVRKRVTNPEVLAELIYWDEELTPQQLNMLLAPSLARLSELVANEVVCAAIGQQMHSLDIPEAMRQGKILIVNLEQNKALKADTLRILGRTINNLVIDAQFQIFGSGVHTWVALDEVYWFATRDTARCLDQMLEVNLHIIAAHHYLSQLVEDGDTMLRDSLLNNCGIKIIFRLNNVPDAKFWSEQTFFDQVDFLKKKYSRMDPRQRAEERSRLKKTYTRGGGSSWETSATTMRGQSTHHDHTHSEGEQESASIADISGSGSMKGKSGSSGKNASVGTSEYDDEESPVIVYHEGEVSVSGSMAAENDFSATVIGQSRGRNRSDADTYGTATNVQQGTTISAGGSSNWSESETIEHYIAYVDYCEEVDVQHYSEQEQISMGAQVINRLANRHCLIKFPGVPAVLCKTADMFDAPIPEAELEQKMLPVYAQPYYSKVEDVEREIKIRQAPFQAKSRGGKRGKEI